MSNPIFDFFAALAKMTAFTSADSASCLGMYEPEPPETLQK